jgi:periplasmic divalent cation tolerance protein
MTDIIIILVTAGSEGEAEKIAQTLVEERLAACVNIISPIRSIYRWEGKTQDDREWLLVIKTEQKHFAYVEARVRSLHSYQVPEIIALPVVDGSERYLEWVKLATKEVDR